MELLGSQPVTRRPRRPFAAHASFLASAVSGTPLDTSSASATRRQRKAAIARDSSLASGGTRGIYRLLTRIRKTAREYRALERPPCRRRAVEAKTGAGPLSPSEQPLPLLGRQPCWPPLLRERTRTRAGGRVGARPARCGGGTCVRTAEAGFWRCSQPCNATVDSFGR